MEINEKIKRAIALIEKVYSYHLAGGNAHVVFDDDNIENRFVNSCIKRALENPDNYSQEQINAELKALRYFKRLNLKERELALRYADHSDGLLDALLGRTKEGYMDSLRQKIEALKRNYTMGYDIEEEAIRDSSHNDTIDQVLEILDEAMAEKDAPDSEGYWWHKVIDSYYPYEIFFVGDIPCINYNELPKSVLDWGGKWIKAITPEPKG